MSVLAFASCLRVPSSRSSQSAGSLSEYCSLALFYGMRSIAISIAFRFLGIFASLLTSEMSRSMPQPRWTFFLAVLIVVLASRVSALYSDWFASRN